ncbi:MAG TPA: undecaprenyldiphospho-muramoylpentapeptide beta-N-acetylglucosaminyltransferase [Bacteroidetes bacterium]|nr:undecaprenyldiphospho-muramoylpentapeptide beta-N-acetylglucosaminyltransferase [Candidatus Limimorpha avicola]
MKREKNSNRCRLLISGGGTGGHIFPAIAIADAFKKRHPDAEIMFIGAKGRMEMDMVPKAGYPIEGLWISGFKRSLSLDNLLFPLKLLCSLVKAGKIIRRFNPDLVVGVGGFASGPTMRRAASMKIPVIIQEQNSFPGVTNRMMANKASRICVAYDAMDKWFPAEKIVLTGNPLRNNIMNVNVDRAESAAFFNLNPEKPVILLVGGSQGALGINRGVFAALSSFKDNDVQLIWQTGKPYFEKASQAVDEMNLSYKIKCVVFIDRMDMAYSLADVVISRAGAISISELSLMRKTVVFVPLPTAAEDHQTKNARRLVDADAALLVPNDATEQQLIPTVFALLADKDRCAAMSRNIYGFAKANAAELVVDEIDNVLNNK